MYKNTHSFKKTLSLSAISLTLAAAVFSGILPVSAEYKTDLNRYEDNLTAQAPEATYNYNYENTSDAEAPGYFELSLEKLAGLSVKDVLEVKSITEITPIDYITKQATSDSKITEFKVSDAVYDDNGTLKIRVSPQSECKKRDEGGCADGMIPAAKPSKITVKIALKADAAKTPTVIFGSGRIFFPNGFDINQIGWKINANGADESSVTVPVIKDETVDPATLTTNSAITNQPTTSNQIADQATTDPVAKPTEDKKNDVVKNETTPLAANSQSLSANQAQPATSSDNTIVVAVLTITGIAVMIGVGLFLLSRQNKAKKAVK